MSTSERDYIRSIERGFAVLLAFDEHNPSPSLGELASGTGLSRPAVRRILLTLQRLGYVTGTDGRWSLTPRVLSIGQHYSATHTLTDTATPHLLALAETAGESASLGVLDGTEVVYAARVPVRRIMSINVSVGTRVPAYATSMGQALLAWTDAGTVDAAIGATDFRALTPRTITDPTVFRDRLADVCTDGYATSIEELELGLVSVAAPVRDAVGRVIGVIACSSSTGRSDPADFLAATAPRVVDTAKALSRDLGLTTGQEARAGGV